MPQLNFILSTPGELADEPELAPLHILLAAAEVTRRTLLAAQPELTDRGSLLDEPEISPRQCLAAAILVSLEDVAEAAERYCAHLDHLAARTRPHRSGDIDF
jgi:hypothetical protein